MSEEPMTKGTVVDFTGDDEMSLIFVRGEEEELLILPVDAADFASWLESNGISPSDLIGRRIKFNDDDFQFNEDDEQESGK